MENDLINDEISSTVKIKNGIFRLFSIFLTETISRTDLDIFSINVELTSTCFTQQNFKYFVPLNVL